MIQIVPFEPQHTKGVLAVILPIQQTEFEIPISLDAQPDLCDIVNFYRKGNGNFWVGLDKQTVVGTIALLDIGNKQTALRKMFVNAQYRGTSYGVAKQLLETLLNWCQSRGVREVFLGTTAQFLAAHRFYAKSGFHEIARTDLPATFPVMKVDSKFYCRAIINSV